MKSTMKILSLALAIFLGSAFTTTQSNKGKWKKLGAKEVTFKLDKDVVQVGPNQGTFSKLKIYVSSGNLNMHKMVVEYRNGSKENIEIKSNFRKGDNTRTIDLNGNKRAIKDITFWYDTKNFSKKRAKVLVFGRK